MLLDHVGLHLLRVGQHELAARVRVGPGHAHRLADPLGRLGRVDRALAGQDRAERDRQAGVALPPLAQVDQRGQAVRG